MAYEIIKCSEGCTPSEFKMYHGEEAHQMCREILEDCNNRDDGCYSLHPDTTGYWKEGEHWVAYDNVGCHCWVEEFSTEEAARLYAMLEEGYEEFKLS